MGYIFQGISASPRSRRRDISPVKHIGVYLGPQIAISSGADQTSEQIVGGADLTWRKRVAERRGKRGRVVTYYLITSLCAMVEEVELTYRRCIQRAC